MTVVWMIRHGQSAAQAGQETADPGLIPLTPTGHRQAGVVARAFDRAPDTIVTSPYLRARQTAGATAERFPAAPVEEWPIEEFTYLGHLHGRPTTGAQRRPLVEAYWRAADPSYVDDEHSESYRAVYDRARGFLAALSRHGTGRVAAFTHGVFMRIVLWAVMTGEAVPSSASMRRFHRFRTSYLIPNCSIVTLRLRADGAARVLGATTIHLPRSLRTGGE